MHHQIILWITGALHLSIFAAVSLHCLHRRRNPGATILWIFVTWSFPFIGALVYLGFGVDRVPDRGQQKLLADERLLRARKDERRSSPQAYWRECKSTRTASIFHTEFDRALDALIPEHPAHTCNKITPLITGDNAYPQMLGAIRNAKHHIHLQSFIIAGDATGKLFLNELAAKARAGIQVRVLYDRFGSTGALFKGLFRRAQKTANLKVEGWTQANPLKRQFQINLRNHRKTLVVDGKTAFFGGINIQSKNTTRPGKPPLRDYHFKVEGPLVQGLQYSFLCDWYFITGESPEHLLSENYFPAVERAGDITARLINTGPDSGCDIATQTFFNAITLAKKQILAVTPYFVPTVDILRALRAAALRGVDVRLIVPKENNHRYAGYAGKALYEDLLSAGAQIFERLPPFMHAKALIVDSEFSLVGTANLDERSLILNYETNVAVYDKHFANAMQLIIYEEILHSDEIRLNEWQRRPAYRRLIENLALLMSPVL